MINDETTSVTSRAQQYSQGKLGHYIWWSITTVCPLSLSCIISYILCMRQSLT